MTTILTTIISLLILLIASYFYIRKSDKKNKFIIHKDFGINVNNQEKRQIIQSKIKHKNISFVFYLIALTICFITSLIGIYLIFMGKINFHLLADVIGIIGSGLMTFLFKNLYSKCSLDVEKLN